EQLYPFPKKKLVAALESFAHVKDVVFVQEEPKNQGAWLFMLERLREILPPKASLRYVGRQRSPSPAAGFYKVHVKEQQEIVDTSLSAEVPEKVPVATVKS